MSPRMLLQALHELEMDSPKITENEELGRLITPQEACNRIAEVVQEAVRKMEIVADEKMQMLKAHHAVEACDHEMEEKAREVKALNVEWLRKKQQVEPEELESIVRLKQAEAEMFQLKANESRQDSGGGAAAEHRAGQVGERRSRTTRACTSSAAWRKPRRRSSTSSRRSSCKESRPPPPQASSSSAVAVAGAGDPSRMMMLSKVQDLLKNVRSMPSGKSDGQKSK